jgi:histidinol-phosphate/aromatic aminotransferase/cobyric acid decarboxylase-like protein
MAALRVGYLLAVPELAREISKAVLPYNLNLLSQSAAEVAVEKYGTEIEPMVTKIIGERERLYTEISRIPGLRPIRSRGNFFIIRSAVAPRSVFDEMLKRDILIRDVSGYPMLEDYIRVSVGTPAENDLLIAALSEVFS